MGGGVLGIRGIRRCCRGLMVGWGEGIWYILRFEGVSLRCVCVGGLVWHV